MTTRPKVFVSRVIPDDGLNPIREATDATIWDHELPPPRPDLLREIEGCEGVLTLLTDRVDDEFLDRAGPQLKVVSNFAVGFDNIDVAACTKRGIPVVTTPGVLTVTTADLAWALHVATARRLAEGDRYVRDGQWKTWGPMLLMGPDVHGATLGIVGFGRIGQAMARRGRGFGMTIIYADPRRLPTEEEAKFDAGYRSFDDLLREADFVSLHPQLLPETRHLMSDRQFSLMKPTAFVINTSRGPVIDEAALVRALKDNKIAGAGLDVYEHEPQVSPELVAMPNVVLTPHLGSAVLSLREGMAHVVVDNTIALIEGKPPVSCLNPQVLKKLF